MQHIFILSGELSKNFVRYSFIHFKCRHINNILRILQQTIAKYKFLQGLIGINPRHRTLEQGAA